MSYSDLDEMRSRAITYGAMASAEGRSDEPFQDAAFNTMLADAEPLQFRDVYIEYYHLGHLADRKNRKEAKPYYSDAKYMRLKDLIEVVQLVGMAAAYSPDAPEFAGKDQLFCQIIETVSDPSWSLLLTLEWSMAYDAALDEILEGKKGGLSVEGMNCVLSKVARTRAKQIRAEKQHALCKRRKKR